MQRSRCPPARDTRRAQEVTGDAASVDLARNSHLQIALYESHIRELHRDLLRQGEKDELRRGNHKSAFSKAVVSDEDDRQIGLVFDTANRLATARPPNCARHGVAEQSMNPMQIRSPHSACLRWRSLPTIRSGTTAGGDCASCPRPCCFARDTPSFPPDSRSHDQAHLPRARPRRAP